MTQAEIAELKGYLDDPNPDVRKIAHEEWAKLGGVEAPAAVPAPFRDSYSLPGPAGMLADAENSGSPRGFQAEGARRPFPAKASELVNIPFEAQAHMFNRPDDVDKMLKSQVGIVAGAAGGGATSIAARGLGALVPEALAHLTPYAEAALTGAGGGYTAGGAEALSDRKSIGEAHRQGVESAKVSGVLGPFGHVVANGLMGLASLPATLADMIKSSKTVTGSDIRALENFGSSPSPLPFKPTSNSPSSQLNVEAKAEPVVTYRNGEAVKVSPPKARPDAPLVTASPHGRGVVGERGAKQLIDEVEAQDRVVGQRLRNVELPAAVTKHGDRSVSVQKYVDAIDNKLGDSSIDGIPGLRGQLETVRKVLTGELEPSMDIFTGSAKSVKSPAAPVSVQKTVTERPFIGPSRRETQVKPREEWASEDGLANEASGEAATAGGDPGEMITVPTGDVRGRVGDSPNYVMNAGKLNKTRDLLDELAGITAEQTGVSKKDHALAQIANEMRGDVRREAPAIGLANRRHADAKNKLERTQERLRTDNNETLGMRLSKQTEEGSTAAGNREEGLLELKRNFPTSPEMSREDVNRIFDAPRALVAEERMRALKPIGQVGGGTKYALNLLEPALARGVYAPLRFQSSLLDTIGGAGAAAGKSAANPVYLNMIEMLADQARRRQ